MHMCYAQTIECLYLIFLQKEKFKIQQTLERLNSENENEGKNASSTETTEQHHTENRHDATLEQFPLAVPAASENEFARQSLEDCKTDVSSNLSEDTAKSINEQSQTQRDKQVPETSSDAVTKTINETPIKKFLSDEGMIDREELSPTLLWDDTEVEIETKEANEEEEYATVTTPSIVCSVTMEGWVNVHTSNIGQPATIKEKEIEFGFIMATLAPVREREVQDEWVELY